MAKGKKTGGKVKGSKNKRTIPVEETAIRLGINVFEVLCLFAMGDWRALGYDSSVMVKESKDGNSTTIGYTITPETRLKAATEAAKYLYSQKKTVDVTSAGKPLQLEVYDYTSKVID